ncbi:MAG: hypothetical protein KDA45_09390, partial [Planctomycetales bacterium]|nr:hypothetical protein [Planctomycetales bacterium]
MRPSYHPWLVLLLALVIRGSGLWLGLESLSDDPDAYAKLAVNWSQSGVLGEVAAGVSIRPTAYRPPLYPWLLSWLVTAGSLPIGSVALLHLVLGVATVWLTWSIAHALGQPLAWLPAAAVAVDPLLLRASQLVMTETLAAFLAVLAWRMWLAVWPPRERATRDADGTGDRGRTQWLALLALGLVWGLSVLARPTAAPWVVLCLLGLCFCGRLAWRQRLADCGWLTLIVLCCITPWTWRNYRTFGQPIWATTHGGYTLLLANNPLLFQHFSASGPSRNWDAAPFHAAWARRHGTQTGDPATRDYWLAPS